MASPEQSTLLEETPDTHEYAPLPTPEDMDVQLEAARKKLGHRVAKVVVGIFNGKDGMHQGASSEVMRLEQTKRNLVNTQRAEQGLAPIPSPRPSILTTPIDKL